MKWIIVMNGTSSIMSLNKKKPVRQVQTVEITVKITQKSFNTFMCIVPGMYY